MNKSIITQSVSQPTSQSIWFVREPRHLYCIIISSIKWVQRAHFEWEVKRPKLEPDRSPPIPYTYTWCDVKLIQLSLLYLHLHIAKAHMMHPVINFLYSTGIRPLQTHRRVYTVPKHSSVFSHLPAKAGFETQGFIFNTWNIPGEQVQARQ
jgi:hypothetical protein